MGQPIEAGRPLSYDIEEEIARNRFERGVEVVDYAIRALFSDGGAISSKEGQMFFIDVLDTNLPPKLREEINAGRIIECKAGQLGIASDRLSDRHKLFFIPPGSDERLTFKQNPGAGGLANYLFLGINENGIAITDNLYQRSTVINALSAFAKSRLDQFMKGHEGKVTRMSPITVVRRILRDIAVEKGLNDIESAKRREELKKDLLLLLTNGGAVDRDSGEVYPYEELDLDLLPEWKEDRLKNGDVIQCTPTEVGITNEPKPENKEKDNIFLIAPGSIKRLTYVVNPGNGNTRTYILAESATNGNTHYLSGVLYGKGGPNEGIVRFTSKKLSLPIMGMLGKSNLALIRVIIQNIYSDLARNHGLGELNEFKKSLGQDVNILEFPEEFMEDDVGIFTA